MTQIKFYKSGEFYWGFQVSGHTGYAEAGEDILCATVSALTMLTINAIEVAYDSFADYSIDEDDATVRMFAPAALPEATDKVKQYAISGLIRAYYLQMCDIQEDYSEYISVTLEERSGK